MAIRWLLVAVAIAHARSHSHQGLERHERLKIEPFAIRQPPAAGEHGEELIEPVSKVRGLGGRFLTCGVLAHGFARLRCTDCALERLVPFSCKGRGFCPSCSGRRMTESAARLVDEVLPRVPVRQ